MFDVLTQDRYPVRRQCLVGSLTGAVSSQRVTEEHEGWLSTVGHRTVSVMAQASLTARQTRRAGAKAGHSDPVVLNGRAIAQRSDEHTSELQSRPHLVCRLLLEKKKKNKQSHTNT